MTTDLFGTPITTATPDLFAALPAADEFCGPVLPAGYRIFDLTINRETRKVIAKDTFGNGSRFDTVDFVGLAKFRTGSRFWPTSVSFWNRNGEYVPALRITRLNRSAATVVAWNDARYAASLARR